MPILDPAKNRQYVRDFYKKYPERRRAKKLREKYGLTLEEYDNILAEQGDACAICKSKESRTKKTKFFHVDHDHKTGKVRGLLCAPCNQALGLMEDSPDNCRAMAVYVERAK